MEPTPTLTGAESVAASMLSAFAWPIVVAYVLDGVGIGFSPLLVLLLTIVLTAGSAFWLCRAAVWSPGDLIGLGAIVVCFAGWLLWLARPALLPPGHGPDLAHHLLLIDYIERRWHLVHDPAAVVYLGEMVQYTPGIHVLAAFAGAWARTDGLHAVYPVLALSVAVKAVFVYLIAMRVLPRDVPRSPFALASVVMLLLPRQYFIGSFTSDSFFAQVAGELFAVGMWWALVVWDEEPSIRPLAMYGLSGAAAFLTWPVLVGPPIVAFGVLVLVREHVAIRERFRHLLIGAAPVLVIAATYVVGRAGGLGMAGTTGAVIRPTPDKFGWWFLGCSIAGIGITAARRRGRGTALLAAAILIQMAALSLFAFQRGADVPYLALKMFYFGVYVQAVAAGMALAEAWRLTGWIAGATFGRFARRGQIAPAIVWLLLLALVLRVGRPALAAPRPTPVLSESVYRAGMWARANVPRDCVEYLVGHPDAAYWLHLSVLGNPRISARTGRDDTYEPKAAIVRWLTPGGLRYGVADLRALPRDVRTDLDVIAEFGDAAVVKRRGPSSCPTEPPPAR